MPLGGLRGHRAVWCLTLLLAAPLLGGGVSSAPLQPSEGYADVVDLAAFGNITVRDGSTNGTGAGTVRTNLTFWPGETVLLNVTTTRLTDVGGPSSIVLSDWRGQPVPGAVVGPWQQRTSASPSSFEANFSLPPALAHDWYYARIRLMDSSGRSFGAGVALIVGNASAVHDLRTFRDASAAQETAEFAAGSTLHVEFSAAAGITGGGVSIREFFRDLPLLNASIGIGPVGALQTGVGGDPARYRLSIDLAAVPGLTLSFWYTLELATDGGASASRALTPIRVLANPTLIVRGGSLAPSTVGQGAVDVPMLALNLSGFVGGTPPTLRGVDLAQIGNASGTDDVGTLRLVEDLDGDLAVDDGGEPVLAAARFQAGVVHFDGLSLVVPAGGTLRLLVTVTVLPTAAPLRTVGVYIAGDAAFLLDAPAGVVPLWSAIASGTSTIVASPCVLVALDGDGQLGPPLTVLAPFEVRADNAMGGSIDGVPVAWQIASSPGGMPTPILVTVGSLTDANGTARAVLQLGAGIGSTTVTATATGLLGSPVTFRAETRASLAAIARIDVWPADAEVDIGSSLNFTGVAKAADGTALPAALVWSVDPPDLGTIDTAGRFTAYTTGSGRVRATNGTVRGNASVTVVRHVVAVTLTPQSGDVAVGGTLSLSAVATDRYGLPINATTFRWASSNAAIITVATDGIATGEWPGTATITARTGNVTGTATFTVVQTVRLVLVSPAVSTVELGGRVTLTADAIDGRSVPFLGRTFAWTVVNASIGRILPNGTFIAGAIGHTRITATVDGVTGTAEILVVGPADVRVLKRVDVEPDDLELPVGSVFQFRAFTTDQFDEGIELSVNWSVDDPEIGRIGPDGTFVALRRGTTIVRATAGFHDIIRGDEARVQVLGDPDPPARNNAALAIALALIGVIVLVAAFLVSRRRSGRRGPGGGMPRTVGPGDAVGERSSESATGDEPGGLGAPDAGGDRDDLGPVDEDATGPSIDDEDLPPDDPSEAGPGR